MKLINKTGNVLFLQPPPPYHGRLPTDKLRIIFVAVDFVPIIQKLTSCLGRKLSGQAFSCKKRINSSQLIALQFEATVRDTEYRHRIRTQNTDAEYRNRIRTQNTDTEYGRRIRTQNTDTEYRRRIQTQNTHAEYRHRIQTQNTDTEYARRIRTQNTETENVRRKNTQKT
jgi:hypothetical protein